ncbi:hypothetical protein JJB07_02570 [Tumebacillus sp. ITR2]|uniref:DUF8042 domain-containing protein n=1 Tax=Tumebacillus amylolyticus TaxID=2801339 RepID=A0ABS1J5L2_9BACL|nr:hypothetical protein [Tumebacillus amylolyticus]MBL0385522.1 hypothetical protein [Tumebacillus amylolyticus]
MENTKQLVSETKESLQGYLPKLIHACEDIASQLQSSQDSWVPLFNALLEGVQWVMNAVTGIQSVQSEELSQLKLTRLQEVLVEVQEALTNQDMVLFPDLLEYELKPLLQTFLEQVEGK